MPEDIFVVRDTDLAKVMSDYDAARTEGVIKTHDISGTGLVELTGWIQQSAATFGRPEAAELAPEPLGDPADTATRRWFFAIPRAALPALAELATCDELTLELMSAQLQADFWPGAKHDIAEMVVLARRIGTLAKQTSDSRTLVAVTSA